MKRIYFSLILISLISLVSALTINQSESLYTISNNGSETNLTLNITGNYTNLIYSFDANCWNTDIDRNGLVNQTDLDLISTWYDNYMNWTNGAGCNENNSWCNQTDTDRDGILSFIDLNSVISGVDFYGNMTCIDYKIYFPNITIPSNTTIQFYLQGEDSEGNLINQSEITLNVSEIEEPTIEPVIEQPQESSGGGGRSCFDSRGNDICNLKKVEPIVNITPNITEVNTTKEFQQISNNTTEENNLPINKEESFLWLWVLLGIIIVVVGIVFLIKK